MCVLLWGVKNQHCIFLLVSFLDVHSITSYPRTQPWLWGCRALSDMPPEGPISAEITLGSAFSSLAVVLVYLQMCMTLRWSSSCILTPCIPVYWIGLNKASINTDWWRKASSPDTFLCAFTGCCNAYSNDFKSIYTGPSFAYVPLDHNQNRLSLPTRFLHQLHAALPASARVLSVLEKLASVFTDVIIILTIMEGGNVNY